MKWLFTMLLCGVLFACSTTQSEEINEAVNCDRMVTCILVGCSGQPFGEVQVPACDAELFERGCCDPLPEITCNCPDN